MARKYSMEGARAQGLEDFEAQKLNLSSFLEDAYGKSLGYYKSKGFGGGLEAPGLLETIRKPYIEQEGKRLTDLWFGSQDRAQKNALAWEANRRANIMTDTQYDIGEETLKNIQNKNRGAISVLCTALYRQGLLNRKYIKADLKYLRKYVSKLDHENYLRWATPIAEKMMKSKLLTLLLWTPLMCWNEYMYQTVHNKKYNFIGIIGKLINDAGINFGRRYMVREVA